MILLLSDKDCASHPDCDDISYTPTHTVVSFIAAEHSGTVDCDSTSLTRPDSVEVVDIWSRSVVSDTLPQKVIGALGPKVPRGSSRCILRDTGAD